MMTVDQIKERILILGKIADIQAGAGIRSEIADKKFQRVCDLIDELYAELIQRIGEDDDLM